MSEGMVPNRSRWKPSTLNENGVSATTGVRCGTLGDHAGSAGAERGPCAGMLEAVCSAGFLTVSSTSSSAAATVGVAAKGRGGGRVSQLHVRKTGLGV